MDHDVSHGARDHRPAGNAAELFGKGQRGHLCCLCKNLRSFCIDVPRFLLRSDDGWELISSALYHTLGVGDMRKRYGSSGYRLWTRET